LPAIPRVPAIITNASNVLTRIPIVITNAKSVITNRLSVATRVFSSFPVFKPHYRCFFAITRVFLSLPAFPVSLPKFLSSSKNISPLIRFDVTSKLCQKRPFLRLFVKGNFVNENRIAVFDSFDNSGRMPERRKAKGLERSNHRS
jgi:hypothetical protein